MTIKTKKKAMPDNRERYSANIEKEQAEAIKALAIKDKRNFSQMIRVLLDEAIAHRQNEQAITVEQVKRSFPEWGQQEVKELLLEGIEYLFLSQSGEASGDLAIAFLMKLVNGEKPSCKELARLAEMLDVDSTQLAQLSPVKRKNGETKSNGV